MRGIDLPIWVCAEHHQRKGPAVPGPDALPDGVPQFLSCLRSCGGCHQHAQAWVRRVAWLKHHRAAPASARSAGIALDGPQALKTGGHQKCAASQIACTIWSNQTQGCWTGLDQPGLPALQTYSKRWSLMAQVSTSGFKIDCRSIQKLGGLWLLSIMDFLPLLCHMPSMQSTRHMLCILNCISCIPVHNGIPRMRGSIQQPAGNPWQDIGNA